MSPPFFPLSFSYVALSTWNYVLFFICNALRNNTKFCETLMSKFNFYCCLCLIPITKILNFFSLNYKIWVIGSIFNEIEAILTANITGIELFNQIFFVYFWIVNDFQRNSKAQVGVDRAKNSPGGAGRSNRVKTTAHAMQCTKIVTFDDQKLFFILEI